MEEANYDNDIDDRKFNELAVKMITLVLLVAIVNGLLWMNYSLMVHQSQRDKNVLISILTSAQNYDYIPPVAATNVTFAQRFQI